MKFQKLEVFEKHFKEAFPQHLSPIYIIVSAHENERKKILSSIMPLLESSSDLKKCSSIKDALTHLNSTSIFSHKVTAILEGVESLSVEEIELLKTYSKRPNPQGYFFLGAANSKQIQEVYAQGKKEMVILDLSLEKPWEEKERIQKWIVQTVAARKKKIEAEALKVLVDQFPADRILLEQELEKLLCYSGEREQITGRDVQALCSPVFEHNPFELARELVWGNNTQISTITDLSLLLSLVAQLRNQFETGLKISALLKKNVSSEEISQHFPRLWPKALQQCLEGVRKKGESFFKKGLLALYDFEWGLKTSLGKPEVLFTLFCSRI